MSRSEDPFILELQAGASATGEIHSFTTESIEIRGTFTLGQGLVLRPGAKVYILADDDAVDVINGFIADAEVAAEEGAAEKAVHAAVDSFADEAIEAVKDAVSQIDPSLADGAQKVADALIAAIEKAKRGDE
ncbi:Uncharacterised protein [Mycobacteroides abscessus subsp. abscessus]|uniref:hypothetical protein n=1 Tax=Mycobacteroides abscessus TaxID=36809 RepID=UPI0009268C2B|nr:hypothetical protein [Mycobacteroides abscessus]MDO3083752.1 hypothetical protein [Mycobacteroides abscessus subsp. abscessus]SHP46681.1 Uncharacterised protein [Mycobacteroides abscessus subsp. abscessus]SHV76697.1 Uncharacterised protein [Mycobacteroides abscessus subsp. abscessus]SHY52475.1 Uncharacterised protein [Mycobacteroides abscessus subsp. abscessus]SHZ42959.1 Uncharacterised protein [Mycobacteroides abscessus subsp. abscessus]